MKELPLRDRSLQSSQSSSSYFLYGTRGVALQKATRMSDVDLAVSRAKFVPGPGEYVTESRSLTRVVGGRISSSIVKSDVDWAVMNALKIPGPGQYNITSALNLKGGKFNTAKPLTDIDILQRKARSEPGPGQYAEPCPTIRGGRFSTACPKTDIDLAMKSAKEIPGPGQYLVDSCRKLSGGRFNLSQVKSDVDWEILRARKLPGPSDYDPDALYRVTGGRISSSRPRTSMGLVEYHAQQVPGPGEYNQDLASIGSRSGRVQIRASTPSLPLEAMPRTPKVIPPEARRRPRSREPRPDELAAAAAAVAAAAAAASAARRRPPAARSASAQARAAAVRPPREPAALPAVSRTASPGRMIDGRARTPVAQPAAANPALVRGSACASRPSSVRGGADRGGRIGAAADRNPALSPGRVRARQASPARAPPLGRSWDSALSDSGGAGAKGRDPLRPPHGRGGGSGGGRLRYEVSDGKAATALRPAASPISAVSKGRQVPFAADELAGGGRHDSGSGTDPKRRRGSGSASVGPAAPPPGPGAAAAAAVGVRVGLSRNAQRLLDLAMESPEFRRLLGRFAPDAEACGGGGAAAIVERYASAWSFDPLFDRRGGKGA